MWLRECIRERVGEDSAAVIAATAVLPLSISDDPASTEVLLAGVDVQKDIRGPEAAAADRLNTGPSPPTG